MFFCVSGSVQAESFRNKDFLNFTPEQKKYWIASTIDTLGLTAFYKSKDMGKCVWGWYYQAEDFSKKHGLIEAYMKQYPDNMPSEVLVALTEQACGAYVRTKD